MNKSTIKHWIIFGTAIAFLFTSCQGGNTPTPVTPTATETVMPTPLVPTATIGPIQQIWNAILTQAASTPVAPPELQVDNSTPISIKHRLGKGVSYAAAMSPDGEKIAVTGFFSVSVYDFKSLKEIWTSPLENPDSRISLPSPQGNVAWSSDGTLLATLSETGMSVWNAKNGELQHTFKEPRPRVSSNVC